MTRLLSIVLFVVMFLAVASLPSCSPGDDDDDDDNENADDDNDADDDTTDNGPTPTPDPFRLLITGTNSGGLASWEQTDDGWRAREVPTPAAPEPAASRDFGPVLIVDGRYGYSAVNFIKDTLDRGYSYFESIGHTWLDFDTQSGWEINEDRPSAGDDANIIHLQAPGDDSLWTGAQFTFTWSDSGVGPGPHYYYDTRGDIYRYGGQEAIQTISLADQSILALAIPSPNFGVAWAESRLGVGTLVSYNGQTWTVAAKPPAMAVGEVDWFWFADAKHVYAVLSKGFLDNYLLETTDGENWETIPAPTGCDAVDPCMAYATGEHAIVIDTTRRTSGFWELRDGQWTCRTAETLGNGGFWEHALVTTDGRAYAVVIISSYEPSLIEITADAVTRIELPADLAGLQSVHALGDGAPPVSYSCGSPKLVRQ